MESFTFIYIIKNITWDRNYHGLLLFLTSEKNTAWPMPFIVKQDVKVEKVLCRMNLWVS